MNKFLLVSVLALLVFSPSLARAATKTWDGSANGNWSVGANWSGGTAPAAGDDLVFPVLATVRRDTTNNFILGSARFRSVRFDGSGYDVYGAVVALTNGLRAENTAGVNVVHCGLELRAPQTFANNGGGVPRLDILGDIALGAHTLTLSGNGETHLAGTISGTGGLDKTSNGVVRIRGVAANTFTGRTRVLGGTLELAKVPFTGSSVAVPGSLNIGDGTGLDTLRLFVSHQIADSAPITIGNGALFDLNGLNETVGPLTMNGGRVDTGAGTLTLGDNITATSTNGDSPTISGRLSLGAGTKTFTVNQGPEYSDLEINADVIGTPGFRKSGDGLILLNGNNSFSGSTMVQEGILAVAGDNALGSPANGTIVNAGASLILFAARVNSEALILNGNGWASDVGALHSGTFSNSWGGPITLLNDSVIGAESTSPLNLLGVISGPGGLTKIGEGTLIYSGGASNTYTGATRVHEGTLLLTRLLTVFSFDRSIQGNLFIGDGVGGASSDVVRIEGSAQINNLSAVTIAASGLFDQNTSSEVIGSLAGVGRVDLGDNQLLVGDDNLSTTYSGQIIGTSILGKRGLGTLTLTGDNPFSGGLVAGQGTLLVNGSQPRSDVTISGGTLGGHGTVGNISASGSLAPGSSPGILSCSNLTFYPGGEYFVELNGPDPGTGFDRLNARGSVRLANVTLHVSRSFLPAANQRFIILANDGTDSINGTFNGSAEGAALRIGGLLFQITYTGGDGNDVMLTRVSAPASTITALTSLSNGDKQLEGLGGPDLIYTIEGTTTLNSPIPWVIVGEAQANGAGVFEFLDINAALYPRRFYRAQSP